MLNWVLAAIAGGLWSTAYGWYFYPELSHWLWRRRHRKRLAEVERAKAYAAWMRRMPARARAGSTPPHAAAAAPTAARPSATVIPFPARTGPPKP